MFWADPVQPNTGTGSFFLAPQKYLTVQSTEMTKNFSLVLCGARWYHNVNAVRESIEQYRYRYKKPKLNRAPNIPIYFSSFLWSECVQNMRMSNEITSIKTWCREMFQWIQCTMAATRHLLLYIKKY